VSETNLIDRHVMPMAWMSPRDRFYKTRMMAVDNCEQLVTPLYALTLEQVAVLEKHATAVAYPDDHANKNHRHRLIGKR
jgi:hypothetical protein